MKRKISRKVFVDSGFVKNMWWTRYSRLSNAQVLAKLLDVCDKENVNYTEDGLEAIVFTAQGDMRQALNNLQVKFNERFKFAISFSMLNNTFGI